MRKPFKGMLSQYTKLFIGLVIGSFMMASCNYNALEQEEPQWLGSSIYDYMKKDGHYTNYMKLIDDLNYTEVLAKTGSKTLFAANDSAFTEFYKKNDWNIGSYEQLSLSQKKLLLNFNMLDDAYLVEMLSNYNAGVLKEGAGLRKLTAISVLDTVPYENAMTLPNTPFWSYYRTKGINLLEDNTRWTTMFFTQKHLDQTRITNEDFKIITGLDRADKDAHVFGDKIIKRDITCKNGYLNILQSVLIAPMNMAQYVNRKPNLSIFASLLERFSAPAYDPGNTLLYMQSHPTFTDSIFTKKYFAANGGTLQYPSGTFINTDMLLPFNPGWNSYASNSVGASLESDMGAMFVPTNDAMNGYINSPEGAVLKERFGSWENIPTDILPLFIKRHMRNSFVESVPSRFNKMVDVDNSVVPVTTSDIDKVYMGTNGVIYETNKTYPPDDYKSVYGPTILSANNAAPDFKTKIWKWAISQNDFRLYLNSLISKYSFFVPTDEFFTKYIDPIAYAKDIPAALKYWYNDKTQMVYATVYKYNKVTGEVGDSIAVISPLTGPEFLKNRLLDLLNMHIVVGGVESGKNFYLTKGNVALKITGSGMNMKIEGGGNMAMNDPVNVTKLYNQTNGVTYFIDKPIQSPLNSVFKVMSQTPEFSEFFTILSGFPAGGTSEVFVNKTNYYGIDFNIRFFNTFNYTVYIPTNEAIRNAITNGLIQPWESQGSIVGINDMTDKALQTAAILNLERFVRYHFQDNSVFLDGQSVEFTTYQSATMKTDDSSSKFGTFKNKYYKIGVEGSGNDLTLTTENNQTAHVVTTPGLYNIMTRDFVFNSKPSSFKEIDGKTGLGSDFINGMIYTSSTAVIHQIDTVLNFK